MLFHKREQGQAMMEYALLIVLLALVCIFMVTVMGDVVSGMYSKILEAWPIG